jgi:hypothetical protein
MVAGSFLIVSIISTGVDNSICIRGNELEVKIETPIDKEKEEEIQSILDAICTEERDQLDNNRFLIEEENEKIRAEKALLDQKRFPGIGRRLDGKNIN